MGVSCPVSPWFDHGESVKDMLNESAGCESVPALALFLLNTPFYSLFFNCFY